MRTRTGYLGAAEEHGRLCDPESRPPGVGRPGAWSAWDRNASGTWAIHSCSCGTPSGPDAVAPSSRSAGAEVPLAKVAEHREQRSPVLVETHLAGRHRPAVPHRGRHAGRRGPSGFLRRRRPRGASSGSCRRRPSPLRGREGPCDERAAEGRREVAPLALCSEVVRAIRFQLEGVFERGERFEP